MFNIVWRKCLGFDSEIPELACKKCVSDFVILKMQAVGNDKAK